VALKPAWIFWRGEKIKPLVLLELAKRLLGCPTLSLVAVPILNSWVVQPLVYAYIKSRIHNLFLVYGVVSLSQTSVGYGMKII
jgi:hypothetical protein